MQSDIQTCALNHIPHVAGYKTAWCGGERVDYHWAQRGYLKKLTNNIFKHWNSACLLAYFCLLFVHSYICIYLEA